MSCACGAEITVLDGVGQEMLCRIVQASGRGVAVEVASLKQIPPPPCPVTLFQAIPKGKTFDTIIQKATELGVRRIVPLITDHVIARPDEDDAGRKAGKWQGVALEAIKQCGQAWLPLVEPAHRLADVLARREISELEIIGALYPGSKHPRTAFDAFRSTHHREPKSVGVWIGPEGDFTQEEVAAITGAGAVPVTFGSLVLKCDTAAMYALSLVNHEAR